MSKKKKSLAYEIVYICRFLLKKAIKWLYEAKQDKKQLKKLVSVVIVAVFGIVLIASMSSKPSKLPDNLVGKWRDEESYMANFPISDIVFYKDGKVIVDMVYTYEGIVTGSNGKYKIKKLEPKESNPVTAAMARSDQNAYNISVKVNSDGTLTVKVKAASGYVYWGKESATFRKR